MPTSPQVSVVMGFRDWGVDRLRLAVRSHRRSALPEGLEVIVVDYGSRDAAGVRSAVEEEGGRLVRVEAAGRPWSRARALNYGIRQAARAPLILTTDSDILFSRRTAETVLAEIAKTSSGEGTYALVQCRDLPPCYPEERLWDFDWASMEASAGLRPRYGMGGCACFPRSFVETVRGYDERMEWWGAEDKDLANRADAAGLELCWVEHADARIYHMWHEKILETHRDDPAFQETSARNRSYLTGSRTLYRNLDEWGGLPSSAVPVSIVIVARDRADRLARAIDSVLGQTYQNFELFVVDAGSKGEIAPIVESFEDPRIRYLKPPPSGIPASRDPGVCASRGTYVCMMEDGDLMLPHCIEDHLNVMTPGSAGSFGGWIDSTGKTKDLRYHPGKGNVSATPPLSGTYGLHAGVMMRREILLSFLDNEDWESGPNAVLHPRLPEAGRAFGHTGTYVVVRRAREDKTGIADGARDEQEFRDRYRALPQAEEAIKIPRLAPEGLVRLFPAVFAPTRNRENAGVTAAPENSPRQKSPGEKSPEGTRRSRRTGLVGDLLPRPAHLVFLGLIAALGGIVCGAWLFGIIDATGFVLGMMVLGAAYALGLLMLWLERSLAGEVTQARLVLANRIESQERHIVRAINDQIAGVRDQITGVRAQQAEDVRRAAAQLAQLANLTHAARMIQRLELRGLPPEGSGGASEDFLSLIVRCISDTRPRTIIGLGSGPSTVIIARVLALLGLDARFYSVEHDRHRLEETRRLLRENALEDRVELVPAPIRETRFGLFYDLEAFVSGLERVDLLIVGGPPLDLGPRIRRPAMDYFHPLLSDAAMVLIDEGHRESERGSTRRWKVEHPELGLRFVNNLQGCLILRKPRATAEPFDAGSRSLAAPRFSISTTKAVFIGGIIATGSTVLKAALMGCDFATSTGKYEEGRHDPDCPALWPEGGLSPTAPASEAFHAWVDSYCRGPWFIEKSAGRFLGFLAIQKRLGPEMSYFLMPQRDPYQALAFIQRRCPERYGLGPGLPPGRILVDDPGLMRRLQQAIDFHERLRPELRNFSYVRYEDLCADPKATLSVILRFLGVGVAPGALERAAAVAKQDIRRYPITVEAEGTRMAANRLCRLWGYPEL